MFCAGKMKFSSPHSFAMCYLKRAEISLEVHGSVPFMVEPSKQLHGKKTSMKCYRVLDAKKIEKI
jgi:hypothetical protein